MMEKHKDFQLLISDIGLPDGNGYDLMMKFQKKFSRKGIALTAYGGEQDVAQSQAAGFTTHLTKPVRVESLDNTLAVVLRSGNRRIFLKNGMLRD